MKCRTSIFGFSFFSQILGSEWDYVIISLVRSVKYDEIDPEPSPSWLREHLGFLTDEHQMNVGLTRARRGLCVIGKIRSLSLLREGLDRFFFFKHSEMQLVLVYQTLRSDP